MKRDRTWKPSGTNRPHSTWMPEKETKCMSIDRRSSKYKTHRIDRGTILSAATSHVYSVHVSIRPFRALYFLFMFNRELISADWTRTHPPEYPRIFFLSFQQDSINFSKFFTDVGRWRILRKRKHCFLATVEMFEARSFKA